MDINLLVTLLAVKGTLIWRTPTDGMVLPVMLVGDEGNILAFMVAQKVYQDNK